MANLKNVIIIVNDSKYGVQNILNDLSRYFRMHQVNFILYTANTLLPDNLDLAIVLGGDGTVLHAVHLLKESGVAIMAFNLGSVGFIADFDPVYWQIALENFKNNLLSCSPRSLLTVTLIRNGTKFLEAKALNDVVVGGCGHQSLISTELAINKESLGVIRSDAVIIATPTGSTAYALSSGGPVISPDLDVMLLVAVSPFSLAMRPLVVAGCTDISLIIIAQQRSEMALNIDGEQSTTLEELDEIVVTMSYDRLNLLTPPQYSFYKVLKQKLGWKG